jgi:hypothetical protein
LHFHSFSYWLHRFAIGRAVNWQVLPRQLLGRRAHKTAILDSPIRNEWAENYFLSQKYNTAETPRG